MISKELFDKVCGFDNAYKIGYWEDSDLCMKIVMEGYKIWFCGESKIYHFGGHSGQSNHKYSSENKYQDNKYYFRGSDVAKALDDEKEWRLHVSMGPDL